MLVAPRPLSTDTLRKNSQGQTTTIVGLCQGLYKSLVKSYETNQLFTENISIYQHFSATFKT